MHTWWKLLQAKGTKKSFFLSCKLSLVSDNVLIKLSIEFGCNVYTIDRAEYYFKGLRRQIVIWLLFNKIIKFNHAIRFNWKNGPVNVSFFSPANKKSHQRNFSPCQSLLQAKLIKNKPNINFYMKKKRLFHDDGRLQAVKADTGEWRMPSLRTIYRMCRFCSW